MKKTLINFSICGCLVALMPLTTMAATPDLGAVFTIDTGVHGCVDAAPGAVPPGTYPNCTFDSYVLSGSYFAMDVNGDAEITENEKTVVSQGTTGLIIGEVSIPGEITSPWLFFGNLGSDYVTTGVTGDTANGLDFSGWTVTWNGIPAIPLGGLAWQPSNCASLGCSGTFNDGLAHFSWSGAVGTAYTVNYTASIPIGDPSGFGGVLYYLHLEGVVNGAGIPLPPTKGIDISLNHGNVLECESHDGGQISADADIITSDTSDIVAISWTLDGNTVGAGESVSVTAPLGTYTLGVFVDTVESGSFSDTQVVDVQDTTRPNLDVIFTDNRNGNEITEVTKNGKSFVTINFAATDACDPAPITENGSATVLNMVEDGDTIRIRNHKNGKNKIDNVSVDASAIRVTGQAVDASGNRISASGMLQILD